MPLFDRDRYQRLDGAGGPGRKPSSSSFCSSATVVVFVALCLVGAWMMASSSNVPVSVSPEAKEEDGNVGFAQSVKGGGDDAPQTNDEGGDTGSRKDDSGGDTPLEGDGAVAKQTTDATSSDTIGGGGGKPAVAEVETPSKNQIFSDENGRMEGGEVAKPEDPEKKVEQQSTEEATTTGGAQASKNTDDQSSEDTSSRATDEKAKPEVTESGQEASSNDDTGGGQIDSSISAQDQETVSTEGGGVPTNQTTFDDGNSGNVDGVNKQTNEEVAGKNSSEEEAAASSDDKVRNTDDETSVAAKNQTSTAEQSEAVAFAAADDTNGTISQDAAAESAVTANSSSATTATDGKTAELLPSGQADLLNQTTTEKAAAFPTQAAESSEEKKKNRKNNKTKKNKGVAARTWKLCNVSTGADYIPCLDNEAAIKALKSDKHYEHRERHCPATPPTCLVPLPTGYRQPIPWPYSRDKIWYHNVPHTGLAQYKGHQNWVRVSGEHLTFPGGGTQFKHGALHYIELMEDALPEIAWGRRSRVVLDVGCGVASFGGFLFEKDALTMSFAPKDEHEAQVQFVLERGIPAVSAVMGTLRLPFPGNVFDAIHCARCRVPWHIEGGKLLIEVNRLLRPGGLFIWSATPVYRKVPEDVEIWHEMAALTKSMCWEMVKRTSDTVDQTAMVVFKKPTSNACYDRRPDSDAGPPMCDAASDDQDAAWNVTLRACMHRVPVAASARGARWPAPWPERLAAAPYWLSKDQTGVYGKPAPADFAADQEHWRTAVESAYINGMGVDWKNVRNVMDMRAVYGGFAAAMRDMKVWVMNVVPIDSPDTLPIIYERGLIGMYHDWCESFSTYPRSYDLLHADHLFSKLKNRCGQLPPVMVEVDRILRPGGTLIVRDDRETVDEVRSIAESLHWEVRMTVSKQGEELLCVGKTTWRPTEVETLS